MSVHLPPEITAQILTKLPAKSLLRFRSVCKTWYSLISFPDFISAQTLNQSAGDRVLVHLRDLENSLSNFSFLDKSFVECLEHPDVPERLRSLDLKIVGSCDGLICFCKQHYTTYGVTVHSFLIWNPSIRKLVELPPRRSQFPRTFTYLFGFGFDSESRDYKVVRIEHHGSSSDEVVAETDIFDLRKGVWRSSSSQMPRSCCFREPSVYLHGNLHGAGKDETSPNYTLGSFNLSGEVSHETEIILDGDCIGPLPRLLVINGLLSVAVVRKKQPGDALQDCCLVWSMKEYGVAESWTKLFTIGLPYTRNMLTPLRFWENGEVILLESSAYYKDRRDALVSYNPESRKSITLLSSTNGEILDDDACFYKESLILL